MCPGDVRVITCCKLYVVIVRGGVSSFWLGECDSVCPHRGVWLCDCGMQSICGGTCGYCVALSVVSVVVTVRPCAGVPCPWQCRCDCPLGKSVIVLCDPGYAALCLGCGLFLAVWHPGGFKSVWLCLCDWKIVWIFFTYVYISLFKLYTVVFPYF